MLTSENDSTIALNVLDMDINLSDYRPLMAVCSSHLNLETIGITVTPHSKSEIAHFRWDYAPLESYYEHTRILLQPVLDSLDNLVDKMIRKMLEKLPGCTSILDDILC
jgi:hypothetical protein